MRRQTPIQSLVYNTLFPDPTPQDPQDFSQFLIRYLILEVRVETHRFYGNLDTTEAKYPGLNYAHAPHRRRLGRFPHHARLFRAFDALGLTTYEISELCKWEGTLWARQRYEREEGLRVEDTTGCEIARWKPRELCYRRGGGYRLSRPASPVHVVGGSGTTAAAVARSGSPRARVSHDGSEGCTSPSIGGRKRKRVAGGNGVGGGAGSGLRGGSGDDDDDGRRGSEGHDVGLGSGDGFADGRSPRARGFKSEIEEEILNVYRQRPALFAVPAMLHPQQHTRRPSLSVNTALSSTSSSGMDRTLFYGTSTNTYSGRRSSTTTVVPFPQQSPALQSLSHMQQNATETGRGGMTTGDISSSSSSSMDTTLSESSSASGSSTATFTLLAGGGSSSPPQLTMDEETASETASVTTEDMHGGMTMMLGQSVGSDGVETPPVMVVRIGMLAGEPCGSGGGGGGGGRVPMPTSAPRDNVRTMMSPLTMVPVDRIVGKVDGQTGLPSPVASDGDAEML
jgi:hypothetical protein